MFITTVSFKIFNTLYLHSVQLLFFAMCGGVLVWVELHKSIKGSVCSALTYEFIICFFAFLHLLFIALWHRKMLKYKCSIFKCILSS